MGKTSIKRRQFKIRIKRKRKEKIKKLKEEHLKAKTKEKKNKIIEKIQKIAPHYPIKEILEMDK